VAPLLRVVVRRHHDTEHVVLLELSHLVNDGWSTQLILRQIGEAYAKADRADWRLPPPTMSFGQWCDRQRRQLAPAAMDALVDRWREVLGPDPAVLGTPLPGYRADVATPGAGHLEFQVDAERTAALRAASSAAGVTLYATTLAAYARVACDEAGRSWLVCQTSVANRRRDEYGVVGPVSHRLHLKIDLTGAHGLTEAARRVHAAVADTAELSVVPHNILQDLLWPAHSSHRRTMPMLYFTLNPGYEEVLPIPGAEVTSISYDWLQAPSCTQLWLTEEGDVLTGALRWERDRFDDGVAERLLRRFRAELAAVARTGPAD
jgi:hypothetical protein